MLQFTVCTIVILLLSTPLFYYLTKKYYAEELIETIQHSRDGKYQRIYPWEKKTDRISNDHQIKTNQQKSDYPHLNEIESDMEEDIMTGVMIQFLLIVVVLALSITLTIRYVTRLLWKPFNETIQKIETFSLGKNSVPDFPQTNIKEFAQLNHSVTDLIRRNVKSYKVQKEFTENASHELQTPMAVFRSKLDLLMQENLNEKQMNIVQEMNSTVTRISKLNRNLLLLAKIDNNQYQDKESIDLSIFIKENISQYAILYTEPVQFTSIDEKAPCISANRPLLEAMVNNLVINALRHNVPNEPVHIEWNYPLLVVYNKAANGSLDKDNLFHRFYNPSGSSKGNGLGLAIVKAICDYHHWQINYVFYENKHRFSVKFC